MRSRAALAGVLALCALPCRAADRRDVAEPSWPAAVCTTLTPDGAGDRAEQTRLQAALDACPAGAAVRLVAGTGGGRFVSGPLRVPSGVALWVDRGASLAASTDARLYDRGSGACGHIGGAGDGCAPFLLIQDAAGSAVLGDGEIDGQGGAPILGGSETWWQLARRAATGGHQNNPRLIQVRASRDVTLYRIRLRDAPGFHVALDRVRGFTAWGVVIDTPADARNTDGIDPGSSSDVTIAHSFIRAGDDDIAIKAGTAGPSRHISILHDHIYAGHGVSIGSETEGGVSDVLVRDVTLDGTTWGLRIKSDASRGGLVQRVAYEDVCLRGNAHPVLFTTAYDAAAAGDAIPVYRDIALRGVAGGAGPLVVAGHDAAHPLGVSLDGVAFAPGAAWRISNADVTAAPGTVSPPPPGATALAAAPPLAAPTCAGRFEPFPAAAR